jgi:hypothetical protein
MLNPCYIRKKQVPGTIVGVVYWQCHILARLNNTFVHLKKRVGTLYSLNTKGYIFRPFPYSSRFSSGNLKPLHSCLIPPLFLCTIFLYFVEIACTKYCIGLVGFMVFNVTFNNISVISWRYEIFAQRNIWHWTLSKLKFKDKVYAGFFFFKHEAIRMCVSWGFYSFWIAIKR